MKLTKKEKVEMAEKLRSTTVVKTIISKEYENYLNFVTCEERNIHTRDGDAHIYIVSPKENKKVYPLYINLHGGGFVREYQKRDTLLSSKIASKLGCKVISVDYKLAPEHPFPSALNECYDIVKWAFDNAADLSVDRDRISVGGHSAGGNLTAAIAIMANQSKDFKIKLQILDYAFLDAATDPKDKITDKDVIPVDRMRAFNSLYIENEKDKSNPLVSPVFATKEMLTGLPPALVITAGKDCFRFEGEKYAMMMVEVGTEVKIKRFLNSKHGFVENCREEFKEAQKLIIETLSQSFN
ncbi:carboxylesterase NlhH [Clostridium ragsdalei P11]|uniref:Carboxylesterase NlhH n=1 Tax=Clostridium ragsdalei P11 TaxID=1353534 RepID=A0A1A6AZL9_9CLOT|nr:alpha/beta hydrolase [Clostridium ragsdalei]OBR95519.1 carboxylesterase NlhH [Clostridium ragsdalei P11]